MEQPCRGVMTDVGGGEDEQRKDGQNLMRRGSKGRGGRSLLERLRRDETVRSECSAPSDYTFVLNILGAWCRLIHAYAGAGRQL